MRDHIHTLLMILPMFSVAYLVGHLKKVSDHLIFRKYLSPKWNFTGTTFLSWSVAGAAFTTVELDGEMFREYV